MRSAQAVSVEDAVENRTEGVEIGLGGHHQGVEHDTALPFQGNDADALGEGLTVFHNRGGALHLDSFGGFAVDGDVDWVANGAEAVIRLLDGSNELTHAFVELAAATAGLEPAQDHAVSDGVGGHASFGKDIERRALVAGALPVVGISNLEGGVIEGGDGRTGCELLGA